jgi:hypothetical protein
MASFNEWLNRRDEAFHQDRFDKAMEKMAARDMFSKMDEMDVVIRDLGNALGQLTRVKDPNLSNVIKDTLEGIARSRFTDVDVVSLAVEEMGKVLAQIRGAEKGMPNPAASRSMTELQNVLNIISSNARNAKKHSEGKYVGRHGSTYGNRNTSSGEDNVKAGKDFRKAATFKRSGKFSPDALRAMPAVKPRNLQDELGAEFE